MSKGHGYVQRTILELIASDRNGAWSVGEICRHLYGTEPGRKHRVAVGRALDRMRLPEPWEIGYLSTRGAERVVFNACSVISRARINWLSQTWLWRDPIPFEDFTPNDRVLESCRKSARDARAYYQAGPIERLDIRIARAKDLAARYGVDNAAHIEALQAEKAKMVAVQP